MMVQPRLTSLAALLVLTSLGADVAGFVDSKRIAVALKDKPRLQAAVRRATIGLFGPSPEAIKIPAEFALPGVTEPQGRLPGRGLALYRRHCQHCHGASGDGDGPTATLIFPRPRDFRRGLFKFTSTRVGAKPTRDDLVRTIRLGLQGTAMPAFDALMTTPELDQTAFYVAWLGARGEVEQKLIDEAVLRDVPDPDPLPAGVVKNVAEVVFRQWKAAPKQVVAPPTAPPPPSRESILRGRDLFLSRNATGNKADCVSCHGPLGRGDGPDFPGREVFDRIIIEGEGVGHLDPKTQQLWLNAHDDWGQPIRMFDLNSGLFKGGRRPIDLYWRIANGINGSKMPAHFLLLEPASIWDLVNFVQALPAEPALLASGAGP
jgi:mono/diheme cytochrome c family protein